MWSVHKFGGTSVGNSDRYISVGKLLPIENKTAKMAVVVSAMKGVTDALIHLVDLASQQNLDWEVQLEKLKIQHQSTLKTISSEIIYSETWPLFKNDFEHIHEILKGVHLLKIASMEVFELISGFGEVWSAQILNAHLRSQNINSDWLNAKKL